MRLFSNILIYVTLALAALDRVTKLWALTLCSDNFTDNRYDVTQFFSCELVFNRGVSWGLFYSESTVIFVLVTISVISITLLLAWIAYNRVLQGYSIIGELLIITGSVSNIIDRIYYQGVIDFIFLHYNDWSYPVFNLADVYIVVGVMYMFYNFYMSKS